MNIFILKLNINHKLTAKAWPKDIKELPNNRLEERKENFIGREDIFSEIVEQFTANKIAVLTSYPGTGKSAIANEFSHRFKVQSVDNFVYWFNCSDDKLEIEWREFTKLFSFDDQAKQEKIFFQIFIRKLKFYSFLIIAIKMKTFLTGSKQLIF